MTPVARGEWLARFSAELRQLLPLLSLMTVQRRSIAAFEQMSEKPPDSAARLTAAEPLPTVIRPADLERDWRRRFARHLLQLHATQSLESTRRAARRTFTEAGDFLPEEAAELYAADPPPRYVGAPGE